MMKSLLARSEESTSHVLAGNWLPGLDLRIWIWINGPGATFDLEFVFWANSAFPSPDDDDACAATFAELVAFAETFRALEPKAECVLSAAEPGDPRDARGATWTRSDESRVGTEGVGQSRSRGSRDLKK